jgi:hypothetical protein
MDADRRLATTRGSLLFAHFGLTGPAPLDLSRHVTGHARPGSLVVRLALEPDVTPDQLDAWLRSETTASGKKLVATVLATRHPQRLVDHLLAAAAVPSDRRLCELAKRERQDLLRLIQALPISLSGALGFEKAEVTAGGVSLAEVDSRTMQSKLVPGLFFAGEVLDLDGPIGGYNFQAAFSTGHLAGSHL